MTSSRNATSRYHPIVGSQCRIDRNRDIMDSSSALASTSASSTSNSKTLSRNALYTPLRAYEQALEDPTTYMSTLKNVPASLKESSLSSFMQRVGEDYHRNRATGPDPKNNGSRPLTVSDMDDRLRQRAVTLIGGGVNSAITTSKPKSTHTRSRTRKRPCLAPTKVQSILSRSHQSNTDVVAFLFLLNTRWNTYILQVLDRDLSKNVDSSISKEMDERAIMSTLVAARDCIELVGAHVRIHSCTPKRHLVNTYGLLVGETKNTWSLAIRLRHGRKKRSTKVESEVGKNKNVDNTPSPMLNSLEIVMIPKDGSSLDVIIPSSRGTKSADTALGQPMSQDPSTAMFPLAPRCIIIRLSGR